MTIGESSKTPAAPPPPLSDARKEQIKLRATFLNGIGIGVILIGVFTPLTRIMVGDINAGTDVLSASLSPVVCFFLGTALHLIATRMLGDLSRDTQ